MVPEIKIKDSMETFKSYLKESRKIKGIEDYEQYHLALEISKTLIKETEKKDFADWLINDSPFFDCFGHEIGLALKECFPTNFSIELDGDVSNYTSETTVIGEKMIGKRAVSQYLHQHFSEEGTKQDWLVTQGKIIGAVGDCFLIRDKNGYVQKCPFKKTKIEDSSDPDVPTS